MSLHYIPSYKKQEFQSVIYLVYQQAWEIVLDGHATLLVGNRYNHTFDNNYIGTRNYYICLLHVFVYQQALENSARWLCYAISR